MLVKVLGTVLEDIKKCLSAVPYFFERRLFMNVSVSKTVEENMNLLATRLAEIRLSELGYRFIPGIYPIFRRFKQYIEARALIIQPKGVTS